MAKGRRRQKMAIALPPIPKQPTRAPIGNIDADPSESEQSNGAPASENRANAGQPSRTRKRATKPRPPGDNPKSKGPRTEEELWTKGRSGAIAGRGFYYQDLVGMWLAVGLLNGDIDVDRLVPEGHDDLSGEGPHPVEYQAKSRQERVGEFPVRTVARYVLEASTRRIERMSAATQAEIVIERGIENTNINDGRTRITDLSDVHPLRVAINAIASEKNLHRDVIELAHHHTDVVVLPIHQARAQSVATLAARHGVTPAVGEKLALVIRDRISACVADNAGAALADRTFVDRTRLEALVAATLTEIDFASLEEAIASGACAPLDLDTPLDEPEYFAGIDAQPGHIAAGLAADRPHLTEAMAIELERRRFALFTGPSGVGKSTAAWAAASDLSHVTWFRIQRLQPDDVEPIARLARALRPSDGNPIGFVVDGVGMARAAAWDELVRRLAGTPNVLLMGSARTEDLVSLTTLPDVGTVEVALDESTAETIYDGLLAQGATDAKHWRESFEAANGLTLEYTYLLTQGQRLDDILTAQVERRVREHEDLQLQILAVASVAHAAGCTLPLLGLQQELGAPDAQYRAALAGLHEEHLVRASEGRLEGLHQLRSRSLAYAVHDNPPPLRVDTLARLLRVIETSQLTQVLVEALLEWPEQRSDAVKLLDDQIRQHPSDSHLLASSLHALRIVDVSSVATQWAESDELANLAPSQRSIAVQLAVTGATDLSLFQPELVSAIELMAPNFNGASPLRDQLVQLLGPVVAECLSACADVGDAAAIATNLKGATYDAFGSLSDTSPFAEALVAADPNDLGELLYLVASDSLEAANRMLDLAGGETAVLARIRDQEPLMIEVERRTGTDGDVAYARVVHLNDSITPDPADDTRRVARLLLRCLPGTVEADVETQIARRTPIVIQNKAFNVSKLLHRYALTYRDVEWNQSQALITLQTFGTLTPTERASRAVALLDALLDFTQDLFRIWVTTAGEDAIAAADLDAKQEALIKSAATVTIPIQKTQMFGRELRSTRRHGDGERGLIGSDADSTRDTTNDDLTTLVHSCCTLIPRQLIESSYRQMAAHIRGVVLPSLEAVGQLESWDLIGLDSPPESISGLTDLFTSVADIAAAAGFGGLSPLDMSREARRARKALQVEAAGDYGRRYSNNWLEARLSALVAAAARQGWRVSIRKRPAQPEDSYWPATELALLVETPLRFWSQALEGVVSLVTTLRDECHLPPVLVIPAVEGQPLPKLGVVVITTAWPAEQAAFAWADDLNFPESGPCATAASTIINELLLLSGLAFLASERELDPNLAAELDDSPQRLTQALDWFPDPGTDPVLDAVLAWLIEQCDRVQAEFDKEAATTQSPPGSFAAATGAAMTDQTEFAIELTGVAAMSSLWDVDSAETADWLAELDSEEEESQP